MDENNFILKEVTRYGLCRFNIHLRPFTQSMLLARDPESMEDGLFFDIRGRRVGLVSDGPLGHPGDGEFNNRTIIAFRHTATYASDRIDIEIDGETTSGVDVYDARKVLPAGRFSVRFTIPKDRIADFFRLDERAQARVEDAFRQAFS